MDHFALTPPGPKIEDLSNVEQLIDEITKLAHKRKARRPKLVAWSFRIEERVRKNLDDAAKKVTAGKATEVNMSDIVNGLLEVYVPLILANRSLPDEAQPFQRQEVAELLTRLTTLLAGPGQGSHQYHS